MRDEERMAERRSWHTDAEWARLLERITADDAPVVGRRGTRVWQWAAIATAFVLLAGTATIETLGWRNRQPKMRTVRTSAGQRLLLRLRDSSMITVGPATTITYDVTQLSREIELDGLADFRVIHDPARPFVVHAGTADVVDVGTDFVVRGYASDSIVHVAVSDGIVSLANRVGDPGRMTLHAGEVALVRGRGAPLAIRDINPASYTAWITGTLTFDDDALADAGREISRWFDVKVVFADSALATRRVSGIYSHPTLPSVLDALSAALGVHYGIAGRTVTLHSGSR